MSKGRLRGGQTCDYYSWKLESEMVSTNVLVAMASSGTNLRNYVDVSPRCSSNLLEDEVPTGKFAKTNARRSRDATVHEIMRA